MSETKIHALEYASRLGHTVLSDLLASATAIEAFITGGAAPAGKPAAGKGKGAASTAAAAPTETLPSSTTATPATTPAPKPAATVAAGGATKEQVGAVMVRLIQANLREKVVEILKEVGSADLSGIPADKYQTVIDKASEALLLV